MEHHCWRCFPLPAVRKPLESRDADITAYVGPVPREPELVSSFPPRIAIIAASPPRQQSLPSLQPVEPCSLGHQLGHPSASYTRKGSSGHPRGLTASRAHRPHMKRPMASPHPFCSAANAFCVALCMSLQACSLASRTRCSSAVASSAFFFSSRRRHTRSLRDWSSDVCSSD